MSVIDMATLSTLSLAVFLQVLAGLIPLVYEDLNPAKTRSKGEVPNAASVPRSVSLVLMSTRGDSQDREMERKIREEFLSREEKLLQISISDVHDIQYHSSNRRHLIGSGPSLLYKFYTRPALVFDIADMRSWDMSKPLPALNQLPVEKMMVYCGLPFPFGREDWELSAYRKVWQRSSLLLVAVTALVRFAYGEPILNLF